MELAMGCHCGEQLAAGWKLETNGERRSEKRTETSLNSKVACTLGIGGVGKFLSHTTPQVRSLTPHSNSHISASIPPSTPPHSNCPTSMFCANAHVRNLRA
eukprot:scaffold14982_cov45-Cyclotella_meneghiniana.AAC.2